MDAFQPNFETPAGILLDRLAAALAQKGIVLEGPITVFGSAPLQLLVDRNLLSADVDIARSGPERALIEETVREIGLSKGNAPFYLQVVGEYVFRPSYNWRERSIRVVRHGIGFALAHPIDVLLGKLHRLEEKDLLAFERVLELIGRPREEELIAELRGVAERFERGMGGRLSDFHANTLRLWPRLFGREIDIEREVLAPVRAEMRELGEPPDYLGRLAEELREYGA